MINDGSNQIQYVLGHALVAARISSSKSKYEAKHGLTWDLRAALIDRTTLHEIC